jgi:hypothetical protein
MVIEAGQPERIEDMPARGNTRGSNRGFPRGRDYHRHSASYEARDEEWQSPGLKIGPAVFNRNILVDNEAGRQLQHGIGRSPALQRAASQARHRASSISMQTSRWRYRHAESFRKKRLGSSGPPNAGGLTGLLAKLRRAQKGLAPIQIFGETGVASFGFPGFAGHPTHPPRVGFVFLGLQIPL